MIILKELDGIPAWIIGDVVSGMSNFILCAFIVII